MGVQEALEKIDTHKDLLGKQLDGANIDDLIIVPTDIALKRQFEKLYISSLDAQAALVPFLDKDVDIMVFFDKHKIRSQNIILSTTLDNVLKMIENG